MDTLKVKVASKRLEAQGICSFELVPAQEGASLPAFTPGAHIDVCVPGGWVRQYSLWNDEQERDVYRIGVLHVPDGRGGSRAMHERVEVGTCLHISAPKNLFPLRSTETPSLLLAGGIGITPLLAMAQALGRRAAPFSLYYCARSRAAAAFLDRLAEPDLAAHVQLHWDDGAPEQRLDIGAVLQSQSSACDLYVCGPKGFMDAVLTQARALGWSDDRLHCEFFQADVKPQDGDQAFDLHLRQSGKTVRVAADQTAAQALAAAGFPVPTSCEQGICGTCLTHISDGIPDHRDSFLMPEERAANNCFTPCCSRAVTSYLSIER